MKHKPNKNAQKNKIIATIFVLATTMYEDKKLEAIKKSIKNNVTAGFAKTV